MTRRLRIAICLESTIGGTRKHARELALGLDRARFEVHLVASFRRSREMASDFPALLRRGVRVHEVPMRREIAPADDLLALLRLARLFGRERFDVVHTHSAKAGFLGRLAARIAGIPRVLHTPHVWPFQWAKGLTRPLYYALERAAALWCDALVCVGPGQRRIGSDSRLAPEGRLVLIENGVDASQYDPTGAREDARASLGVFPWELAVGMVARMAPQKGVGRFLEAARAVVEDRSEARFFLVGSGPLEGAMRRRAASLGLGPARVSFLGHREDMERLYGAFDVFVLSSLYEGLPYVVLEAMAARVPVVATRAPGTEDIVEDGVTGRLVPLEEPDAIAKALVELLDDPDARARLADAAHSRVRERYTRDRFIGAHERLYLAGATPGVQEPPR